MVRICALEATASERVQGCKDLVDYPSQAFIATAGLLDDWNKVDRT